MWPTDSIPLIVPTKHLLRLSDPVPCRERAYTLHQHQPRCKYRQRVVQVVVCSFSDDSNKRPVPVQ